jgi:hypothetical protein
MQYCRMLMADIADERMAEEPLPGVNHPAWKLGPLCKIVRLLTSSSNRPECVTVMLLELICALSKAVGTW